MALERKLIVLGNVNLDLGLGPISVWPKPGTEVTGERAVYRPGGSAGNAALAAAALGVPVELHVDVGKDALGDWLITELAKAGVDCTYVRRPAVASAFSFGALHPDGERSFFSFLGHLASQGVGDRDAILAAPAGSVVVACGYYLLPEWRGGALRELFAACRRARLTTALDTGWPPDDRFDLDELRPLFRETDLLLPNAAEAFALTGMSGEEVSADEPGTERAARVQRALQKLADWVPTPVVKDGRWGAWGVNGREVIHRAGIPVTPDDTIGAGDVFNAALIQALLFDGQTMGRALDWANTAARLAITSRGKVSRYPSAAEIEAEMGGEDLAAGA